MGMPKRGTALSNEPNIWLSELPLNLGLLAGREPSSGG